MQLQHHIGNGTLSHLFLTVTPSVFNTLIATPLIPPPNPIQYPIIPNGSTGLQISDIRNAHACKTIVYKLFDSTDKAIKQFILGAVDDMFVQALHNHHIGYAKVTLLQILAHLYATYAQITAADLETNGDRIKAPYNVNLPTENVFDQIKDRVEFSDVGNSPYTPTQVVNTAFNVLFKTGIFADN